MVPNIIGAGIRHASLPSRSISYWSDVRQHMSCDPCTDPIARRAYQLNTNVRVGLCSSEIRGDLNRALGQACVASSAGCLIERRVPDRADEGARDG